MNRRFRRFRIAGLRRPAIKRRLGIAGPRAITRSLAPRPRAAIARTLGGRPRRSGLMARVMAVRPKLRRFRIR